MNELNAWDEILQEWKKVKRMKRLVQELCEQVGGTLFYILEYAKKNNIVLPNRDAIYRMADRIHYLMDEIEPPKLPDESLQSDQDRENRRRLDRTLIKYIYIRLMISINNTATTTMVVVFGLFLFIVLANTIAYAQQVPPPSPSSNTPSPTSPPKLHAVKIISPTKGQQIPASKDLTISGTSIDNATSNCQVSMIANHVRPYQPATAAGTGGTNDYSKWNFVLTSNYTTINPGPDNRITAKYTCTDNPAMASYFSVNVTGVVAAAAAAPAATTTAYPQQQQQQQQQPSNQTENNIGNPLAKIPIIGKLFGGK